MVEETHTERWHRLGYNVEWSDVERAYCGFDAPIRRPPRGVLFVLSTITDVDAWIAAHPASGGNTNGTT